MGKVISINSRKFLGNYYAQSSDNIPDEATFFAGIIMVHVLPQLICSVYGGLASLITLTGTGLVGIIWGLVMYYKFPFEVISCVSTGTVPQAPPSSNKTLKKAA
jgi:hypothetical protein